MRPVAEGLVAGPGIEPVPSVSSGGLLSTPPPGKSCFFFFYLVAAGNGGIKHILVIIEPGRKVFTAALRGSWFPQ